MNKKLSKVIICGVIAMMTLTACGGKKETKKSEESNSKEKTITVGCEATTPGWIQASENGDLAGYDYDVWQEIGKRTGYKIKYKVMEWDGMWSMLDQGRIDSVGEQISISPERKEKYNFSEPYAYNVYCLLAAKNNKELKTMNDLKSGMTISCETNTSDENMVNAIDKEYNVKLKKTYYDGMSVQDVALGRCDLWPRAETSCIATIKEINDLKILGKTDILEINAYPFAKTKRGEKLSKEVSEAIKDMHKDGTLKKISEKWFGTDISERPKGAKELQ